MKPRDDARVNDRAVSSPPRRFAAGRSAETLEYHRRFVRTGLSARLPYLVGVDAVDTATDFGPTALRLTGAAQVLDEVSV